MRRWGEREKFSPRVRMYWRKNEKQRWGEVTTSTAALHVLREFEEGGGILRHRIL